MATIDLSEHLSRSEVAHALHCSGEYVGLLAKSSRLPCGSYSSIVAKAPPDRQPPTA